MGQQGQPAQGCPEAPEGVLGGGPLPCPQKWWPEKPHQPALGGTQGQPECRRPGLPVEGGVRGLHPGVSPPGATDSPHARLCQAARPHSPHRLARPGPAGAAPPAQPLPCRRQGRWTAATPGGGWAGGAADPGNPEGPLEKSGASGGRLTRARQRRALPGAPCGSARPARCGRAWQLLRAVPRAGPSQPGCCCLRGGAGPHANRPAPLLSPREARRERPGAEEDRAAGDGARAAREPRGGHR